MNTAYGIYSLPKSCYAYFCLKDTPSGSTPSIPCIVFSMTSPDKSLAFYIPLISDGLSVTVGKPFVDTNSYIELGECECNPSWDIVNQADFSEIMKAVSEAVELHNNEKVLPLEFLQKYPHAETLYN